MAETSLMPESGPSDDSRARRLEHANDELRAANVLLARRCLGASDSAAAARLSQQQRVHDELEAAIRAKYEQKAARDEAEREQWAVSVEAQIAEHKALIAQMESTRAWRVATGYWAWRDRLRGLMRRR